MSGYSGKCDIADCYGDMEDFSNAEFYMWVKGRDVKLDIHSQHDLMPYYPFLVSCSSHCDGHDHVVMSNESFVDREEREHLNYVLQDVLKEWRKCKRKKEQFNPETIAEKSWWHDKDLVKEIAEKVAEDKGNTDVNDLKMHRPLHDYYREKLYKDMVADGYDEFWAARWVYGWERAFEMIKEKKEE